MTDVYLYVLDSLRPDFVGCYNQAENLTPNLDAFSRESVRFTNVYSQDTWTKPCAVNLLTGLYAPAIEVTYRTRRLPPEVPTLATLLKDNGYQTLALSSNGFVVPHFGFDSGFDEFPDLHSLPRFAGRTQIGFSSDVLPAQSSHPVITANDLNQMLEEWLSASANNGQPRHVMIWSMDLHGPHFDRKLADEGRKTTAITYGEMSITHRSEHVDSYRRMVRYADRQFGEFLRILRANNRFQDSIVIVCSDHGESLGERGLFGHAALPFDELIHVPLWIKLPNGRLAGRSCASLVELTDVVPTIVDVLNLNAPWPSHGRNLMQILGGTPFSSRRWTFTWGQASPTKNRYTAIRARKWKYINLFDPSQPTMPGDWFFDLISNPTEVQDLESPKIVRPRRTLDPRVHYARFSMASRERRNAQFFKKHLAYSIDVQESPEVTARLQALGYLED